MYVVGSTGRIPKAIEPKFPFRWVIPPQVSGMA